jgi:protein-disulfide isomerase
MNPRLTSSGALLALFCTAAAAQGASPPAPPAAAQCPLPAPAAPALTREQGAQILQELVAIQDELKALGANGVGVRPGPPAPPTTARLPLGRDPISLGSVHAPVTIVEFNDLQCPFCRAFAATTFASIERGYIATGKVRFISRDMPLSIHPYATGAAEAERCAGAQGKFWQFRQAAMAMRGPPTPEALAAAAAKLGLNTPAYQRCVAAQEFAGQIDADIASARAIGVRGTPTFVIGTVAPGPLGGKAILSGAVLRGNRPYADFQAAINAALARAGKQP